MTEPLYSSRAPVFRVDGAAEGTLGRDLVRMEVEDSTAGLRTLRATFLAVGPQSGAPSERLQYLDGRTLDFGRRLEVSLGPPGDERIVFDGVVSALEADFTEGEEPVVTAFAEDALMRLRMTRRTTSYTRVSDADIVRAVASHHGLGAEVDADGLTYDVVQQWNQSDLAFLRERAALVQAEVWVEGTTLHMAGRTARAGTTVRLAEDRDLVAVRLRADLAHQRTSVTVSGYDATSRDRIEATAGGEAVAAEVTGGTTGVQVLERALGTRESRRVRDVPLVDAEADSRARAEMLGRSRGFVTVVGTTRGTPQMTVGSRIELSGTGAPFDGAGYRATRVCHTYDLVVGHRTRFVAERPTIGGPSA